ncbi:UNVERIFIED_ORG: hypothetical protein E4P37_09985 [Bacillus sp. AZ43]
MSLFEILSWIAGVASIVGLLYAVLAWNRDRAREKRLVFDTRGGPPLARSRSLGDYELKILFKHGDVAEEVNSAFVTYGLLANLGREPIRRNDIAPANPLMLRVQGARVLSMEIDRSTRDVCQIALGDAATQDESVGYPLTFDFLDGGDGALITILTDGRPKSVDLQGDIIGMPAGVRKAPRPSKDKPWKRVVKTLAYWTIFLGPQALIGYWFHQLTERPIFLLWLIAPLAALVLSVMLAIALDTATAPSGERFKFPKSLIPPHARHLIVHSDGHRESLMMDLLEEKDSVEED